MKEVCTVTNKSTGRVIYSIPEDHIRRDFAPREIKRDIKVDELVKLSQQAGGRELIYNYLYIHDPTVARYVINGEPAPEYWITEKELPDWMKNCSLPEFQDALDFAPEGTKDLIKKAAVSMPLNDYSKREAIKEQLGFDVSKVLENTADDGEDKNAQKPAARRVQSAEEQAPTRRVIKS